MIGLLERYLPAPVVILLLVAFIVLMIPVVIPSMYVMAAFYELRFRSFVKRSPCPNCGRVLGMDSLLIGREEKRLQERTIRSLFWGERRCLTEHGVAPRLVCVWCGTRWVYRDEHGFVDEAESERLEFKSFSHGEKVADRPDEGRCSI